MPARLWVFDTSSLIAIKPALPRDAHERVFKALTRLVRNRRLVFPEEVLGELKRERPDRRRPRLIDWAIGVESLACRIRPSFDETKAVLAQIPEIIDPSSESACEEADPYVLALARTLLSDGRDVHLVTEETRDAPSRVSLHTACNVLRISSVPVREFLRLTSLAGEERRARRVRRKKQK